MFLADRDLAAETGGRRGARRGLAAAALCMLSTIALTGAGRTQEDPAVVVTENAGSYRVTATFTVPQSSALALAALTDYPAIPRFMPEVRSSTVIERDGDRAVVEQEAVARFLVFSKRIHLVLDVQQEAGALRFRDRCGRSFLNYEGVWTLLERDGRTVVRYELAARPAFDVPEFLLKRLLKRDAGQMIERLKAEIEARARPRELTRP